jgi:hypothetical protein
MAYHDEGGHLSKMWCCFTCRSKFAGGRLKWDEDGTALCCPVCKSEDTHPIFRPIMRPDPYVGPMGTKQ